jgi:hypothetical protein
LFGPSKIAPNIFMVLMESASFKESIHVMAISRNGLCVDGGVPMAVMATSV